MTAKELETESDRLRDAVGVALDIGEQILYSEGEISRVEDTVTRISRAYGAARVDVFAITSLILVSVTDGDGNSFTLSRRVYGNRKNMRRVEEMNSLSRRLCGNPVPPAEAKRLFDAAMDRSAPKTWIRALGTLIVCFSFTAFFGGGIGDCLAALLVGIGMFGMEMLSARLSVNRVLYNVNASFVAGLLAILTVLLGIGNSVDHIMFGVIMLLIPGASLTGSIENLMVGDTLSGLMGIAEAIIKSLALAAGVALRQGGHGAFLCHSDCFLCWKRLLHASFAQSESSENRFSSGGYDLSCSRKRIVSDHAVRRGRCVGRLLFQSGLHACRDSRNRNRNDVGSHHRKSRSGHEKSPRPRARLKRKPRGFACILRRTFFQEGSDGVAGQSPAVFMISFSQKGSFREPISW